MEAGIQYAKTEDGVSIAYSVTGEGPPLVLVHGYTGDVSEWENQIEEFAGDFRVLVLDNRGHGQSEAPTDIEAYTVELMVEDTLAVIAVAGFEKYHLVGHSMGGAVALEIALRHPGRLFSLTLHDTSHSFADHDQPGETLPYVPPEHIKMGAKRIAGMSKTALAGTWKGLIGWRGATDRDHQIETPTLIIYGDRDGSRIIEGSQRLKELIPHATIVVIKGGGHSPQRQCPDEFNAALRRHLEGAG